MIGNNYKNVKIEFDGEWVLTWKYSKKGVDKKVRVAISCCNNCEDFNDVMELVINESEKLMEYADETNN